MRAITVDRSAWPTLVVTFQGDEYSDEEFERYLNEYAVALATNEVHAQILDTRGRSRPTARQRSMQVAWMRAHHDDVARLCLGVSFIVENAVVRGALSAILWVQPLATEHTVVGSWDAAVLWTNERLAAANLKPHPRLRRAVPVA